MSRVLGIDLSIIDEREVKLVGRKGAVGLAALKLATCGFATALLFKAAPNEALTTYLASLATLCTMFFAGNAAEHFAKKGQATSEPGAPT